MERWEDATEYARELHHIPGVPGSGCSAGSGGGGAPRPPPSPKPPPPPPTGAARVIR